MGVSFGNQPCLDPLQTAIQCKDRDLDVSWVGKPNSFRLSVGASTGQGWVLMSLAALQTLQASDAWVPPFPPPTNLAAFGGVQQITLTWAAGRDAVAFNIYRTTQPGGEAGSPSAIGIPVNSYTDSGLQDGKIYFYQVSALNKNGRESLKSTETFVSTAPAGTPPANLPQAPAPPPWPPPPMVPPPHLSPKRVPLVDMNRSYDLVFDDLVNPPVTIKNLRILTTKCLTPGAPYDPDSVYMLTLCDRRRLLYWANNTVNGNYNLRVCPACTSTVQTTATAPASGAPATTKTASNTSYSSMIDAGNLLETWITTTTVTNNDGSQKITMTTRTLTTFPNCDTHDLTTLVESDYDPAGTLTKQQVTADEIGVVTTTDLQGGTVQLTTEIQTDVDGNQTTYLTTTTCQAGEGETGLTTLDVMGRPVGQVYRNDSLALNDDGTHRLWTWDELFGDLWARIGTEFVGAYPGLKGTGVEPLGDPQNIMAGGKALDYVMSLLGTFQATISLNPLDDVFKIVLLGADDPVEDLAEKKWEALKILDDYPLEPDWNHIPQTVDVAFSKQGFCGRGVPLTQNPIHHITLTDPTEDAKEGVSFDASTMVMVDPQVAGKLDVTQQSMSNVEDLQARAVTAATYAYKLLHRKQERTHKVYSGCGPPNDRGLLPGNRIRAVNYEDRGLGIKYEIVGPGVGADWTWMIQWPGLLTGTLPQTCGIPAAGVHGVPPLPMPATVPNLGTGVSVNNLPTAFFFTVPVVYANGHFQFGNVGTVSAAMAGQAGGGLMSGLTIGYGSWQVQVGDPVNLAAGGLGYFGQ